MSKISGDKFVEFFKNILKNNGFLCRSNFCTIVIGDWKFKVGFSNRWGAPLADVFMEVSNSYCGKIVDGDIFFIFPRYSVFLSDNRAEKIAEMDDFIQSELTDIVVSEIVPGIISLSDRELFLTKVSEGYFSRAGVYKNAVEKLKASS